MVKAEQCQLGFENKPTELHILLLFPPLITAYVMFS